MLTTVNYIKLKNIYATKLEMVTFIVTTYINKFTIETRKEV